MKLVLNNVRLSYANVWEPKVMNDGEAPKYSSALIMDPKTKDGKVNIAKLEKAVNWLMQEAKTTKFGGKIPAKWSNPLHEGDEDKVGYAGMLYVNAKSSIKPTIVDKGVNPILDQSEVYSGCYANVSISLYAFARQGNNGVGVGLGHIQKIADGESLGGMARAEEVFEVLEDDGDLLG